MKKKLSWNVRVDGQNYAVRCVPYKTVFDVFVDDELALRVPRHSEDGSDMEEELRIGSKVCRFVVYDGEPDLAVDGILQGVERELRSREIRDRVVWVLGGLFAAGSSAVAAFLWFVFDAAGEPIFGGYLTLTFIGLFGLGGLLLIFFGLKPKKRIG